MIPTEKVLEDAEIAAIYLRALLDSELKTNPMKPTSACEEAFRELNKIYGLTDKADPAVRPPARP